MSVITYNRVTLPYPFHTSFKQEAVRDESNTDWHLTKFDVAVQFVVNANYIAELAQDLNVADVYSPAEIMGVIRARLMEHRRPLSIRFAHVELIPQSQANLEGSVDAKNGPIPQSCSILQLANETFMCSWHVIAHYWERNVVSPNASPPASNLQGNTVLYNRWSESIDINNRDFSTRTRSGKFVIRSDNKDGFIADQVRTQMAIVGVPEGFLRDNSKYTVDPSGLGISYSITDREVFKMPPEPAFEANGTYYESASRMWAKRYGEVNVTLKGAKNTPQAELINTAIAVVFTKVNTRARAILGLGKDELLKKAQVPLVESAGLRINLYDNEVNCTVRVFYKQNTGRAGGIVGWHQIETSTPGSGPDFNYVPPYRIRGTASILLQAAAYYDPSIGRIGTHTRPLRSDDNPKTKTGDGIVGGTGAAVGTLGIIEEPSHVG